jgi:hypothetical protein
MLLSPVATAAEERGCALHGERFSLEHMPLLPATTTSTRMSYTHALLVGGVYLLIMVTVCVRTAVAVRSAGWMREGMGRGPCLPAACGHPALPHSPLRTSTLINVVGDSYCRA